MRFVYDRDANAAFLFLAAMPEGGPARTAVDEFGIIVAFDASDRLLRFEFLMAREKLPPALLDQADMMGGELAI